MAGIAPRFRRRAAGALVVGTLIASVVAVAGLDASATAGTTERVSLTSTSGQTSGDNQTAPALSADGRYVAFFSRATNVVPGAPGSNIFLRDRTAGTTELVSVANDGSVGNGGSGGGYGPAISGDGRYVAFESLATNLVTGDTNSTTDIFVRDRVAHTTERVSVSSDGQQGTSPSGKPSISADGRFVVFESQSQNLAPEDGICCDNDVFVHDRQTGVTSRVSVKRITSNGAEPAGNSQDGDISADGRYVAFIGPCDTLAPCTGFVEPQVFLRDLQTGTTAQLTHGNSGQGAKNNPDVNTDGSKVAFEAAGTDLVPGDTNNTGDVFVVDSASLAITRASVDSAGNQGNDNSSSGLEGPAISGDGTKVAFESFATNLVAGDTNAKRDVFVHNLSTGATTRESVDSTDGQSNGNSTGSAISADGAWVGFMSSASNLVSDDTNAHTDAFVHQLAGTSVTTSSTSEPTSSTTSTTEPTTTTSTSEPTTTSSTTTSSTTTTTTRPPRSTAPIIDASRGLSPAAGPDVGGTQVGVRGSNLGGGTVFLDGIAVTTEPCSPRSRGALCFTTPPHDPGVVSVTVHTPDGEVSNAVPFRYTATPSPSITRITPATGPDVGGTRVEVGGPNLDQGTVLVDGNAVPTTECGKRNPRQPTAVDLCYTAPPHAPGSVVITVSTPLHNPSNGVTYSYTDTPPPAIHSLFEPNGPDVGGDVVHVRGDNLDQGVVLVDGTPVSTEECQGPRTRFSGPTLDLCFTTPSHAPGQAMVTVATPNGKSSNPAVYDYKETPPPVIVDVKPSSVSTTGGARVTVIGDIVAQGTAYIDGIAVASGPCTVGGAFPGRHQSVCFDAPPHAPGDVTIVIHNPNGKVSNGATLTYVVSRRQ